MLELLSLGFELLLGLGLALPVELSVSAVVIKSRLLEVSRFVVLDEALVVLSGILLVLGLILVVDLGFDIEESVPTAPATFATVALDSNAASVRGIYTGKENRLDRRGRERKRGKMSRCNCNDVLI